MLQLSLGALMSCSVCLGNHCFVLNGVGGSLGSAASPVLECWAGLLNNVCLAAFSNSVECCCSCGICLSRGFLNIHCCAWQGTIGRAGGCTDRGGVFFSPASGLAKDAYASAACQSSHQRWRGICYCARSAAASRQPEQDSCSASARRQAGGSRGEGKRHTHNTMCGWI